MIKTITIKFFTAAFLSSAFIFLTTSSVFAAEQTTVIEPTMYPQVQGVMSCMVPADTVKVLMQVEMYNDTSKDFITFTLDEDGQSSVFYNQDEKGKVKENIEAGSLNMLVLTEKMAQENGVIKNVGLLSLSKQDDAFTGFLVAKGNIYPLICVSLLPKKAPEVKPTPTPTPTVPSLPKNDPINKIKKQISTLKTLL